MYIIGPFFYCVILVVIKDPSGRTLPRTLCKRELHALGLPFRLEETRLASPSEKLERKTRLVFLPVASISLQASFFLLAGRAELALLNGQG